MITSSQLYPFGGKVSTVETPSFKCAISTAKAGVFKKQSVVFIDLSAGVLHRRRVAEFFYRDHLDKNARLEYHDPITWDIDERGMKGHSLVGAISSTFQELEEKGIGRGLIAEEP